MTNQRRVIASVLEQADDHPDVEELYAACRVKTVHFNRNRLSHREIVRRSGHFG